MPWMPFDSTATAMVSKGAKRGSYRVDIPSYEYDEDKCSPMAGFRRASAQASVIASPSCVEGRSEVLRMSMRATYHTSANQITQTGIDFANVSPGNWSVAARAAGYRSKGKEWIFYASDGKSPKNSVSFDYDPIIGCGMNGIANVDPPLKLKWGVTKREFKELPDCSVMFLSSESYKFTVNPIADPAFMNLLGPGPIYNWKDAMDEYLMEGTLNPWHACMNKVMRMVRDAVTTPSGLIEYESSGPYIAWLAFLGTYPQNGGLNLGD